MTKFFCLVLLQSVPGFIIVGLTQSSSPNLSCSPSNCFGRSMKFISSVTPSPLCSNSSLLSSSSFFTSSFFSSFFSFFSSGTLGLEGSSVFLGVGVGFGVGMFEGLVVVVVVVGREEEEGAGGAKDAVVCALRVGAAIRQSNSTASCLCLDLEIIPGGGGGAAQLTACSIIGISIIGAAHSKTSLKGSKEHSCTISHFSIVGRRRSSIGEAHKSLLAKLGA
mmetsp:Transcript_30867/g.48079  ORF Transcript_30867/g.48079 Transcript_30867/m.48079 type:complete len:221 (-) Transcript_30867:71-733(-)